MISWNVTEWKERVLFQWKNEKDSIFRVIFMMQMLKDSDENNEWKDDDGWAYDVAGLEIGKKLFKI